MRLEYALMTIATGASAASPNRVCWSNWRESTTSCCAGRILSATHGRTHLRPAQRDADRSFWIGLTIARIPRTVVSQTCEKRWKSFWGRRENEVWTRRGCTILPAGSRSDLHEIIANRNRANRRGTHPTSRGWRKAFHPGGRWQRGERLSCRQRLPQDCQHRKLHPYRQRLRTDCAHQR